MVKTLKRGFLKRLFGKPATGTAADPGCASFDDGVLVVDLARAPELERPGGALRFEEGLPERVLVVHGEDGSWRAFVNRCRHGGRRVDPVPGTETVQCCSVGKATYDYEGRLVAGKAKGPLAAIPVKEHGGRLRIRLP